MARKRYRDLHKRFFAHLKARDVLLCVLAWAVLTILGTIEGFTFTRTAPEKVSMLQQRFHNTLDGVLLHGRIAAKLVRERIYHISDVGMPLVMHAVGWGVVLLGVLIFLTIRRGLHRRWKIREIKPLATEAPDAQHAQPAQPPRTSITESSPVQLQSVPSQPHTTSAAALAQSQLAAHARSPLTKQTISRRRMLIDASAGATLLAGGALAFDAFAYEPFNITLRKYRVAIRDLPKALSGLRLVQVSDTHVGTRVPAKFVQAVCEQAAALKPDVVLFTGDYVHSGELFAAASIASMKPLIDLGVPTVAVLGNHDWYGGATALKKEFAKHRVPLIDNSRLFLDASTRALLSQPTSNALCIAGVGDYTEDQIVPVAALGDCPPETPRLLLSHNPDAAEDALLLRSNLRVDLMISGHTHGGQVRFPFLGTPIVPSKFGSKYAGGIVQGPAFPVLISRGIGMSLIPVRWNVAPEIVEIELVNS